MAPELDTHPYRNEMVVYAHIHGLAVDKGFDVNAHGPLLKPGRAFLLRIQKHMMALYKKDKTKNVQYKKIKASGILDAPTRLVLLPPVPFGTTVANWCLHEVGVHEVPWGSNSGARVHYYQTSTGDYNDAWCASFRSKALQECGYNGPVSARAWAFDDIGIRISNGAQHIGSAVVGDAVTFDIGDGHIGTFLGYDSKTEMVKTVDGNTGDQVAVRERSFSVIRCITRQGK